MEINFTLKCIALSAFTLVGFKAQAQTYYADGTVAIKSLTVDTNLPDGASTDGTVGSWYKWNPNAGATTTAAYTAGDDPDGVGINDSNQADITWDATWPGATTVVPTAAQIAELTKDYKITAEEFNSCQTTATASSTTEIDVKLVRPDVLFIDADTSACSGSTATITLYGTPNAVVNYTITNGTAATAFVTLDSAGKADVTITPTAGGNVTFTISSVVNTFTQPVPLGTTVPFTNSTIISFATATITVGASPVISPIVF
ncbi:hypothetical protein [Algoriella sp.]|uniref:hypothetical protein n=1 Tax=Algoriella sp. TaxID=1872434 RepID=UPI001B029DC0|nr:hypothetical protein [Algoriella sp.]MBO6212033.1 hypothetical protein [Algoriella sp.]